MVRPAAGYVFCGARTEERFRGKAVSPRCWEEAVAAGFYEPPIVTGRHCPSVQILTIAELLAGRGLEYPKLAPATFKKAPRKYRKPEQSGLWSDGEA